MPSPTVSTRDAAAGFQRSGNLSPSLGAEAWADCLVPIIRRAVRYAKGPPQLVQWACRQLPHSREVSGSSLGDVERAVVKLARQLGSLLAQDPLTGLPGEIPRGETVITR